MVEKTPEDNTAGRRQTFAALLVVALLLLGGWLLMSALQDHRDVENCIASGRRDCMPIVPEK